MFESFLRPAFFFEQRQDASQILFASDHGGINDGLFDLLDLGRIRELGRVINLEHLVSSGSNAVAHAGSGGDEVDVELAFQALLHDFQMQ